MKKGLIFAILSIAFLMTAFASAEIFISPVNPLYNYGDEINLQVALIPNTPSASHLTGELTCGSASFNIFNNYYNLAAGQEQQVNVGTILVNPLLAEVIEPCSIIMNYGSESASSGQFTLSRKLNLDANLDQQQYNPSGPATITGTAIKESGSQVDGFVELSAESIKVYKSGSVIDGNINIGFQIPSNAKSGTHSLSIRVYDADVSGKILNDGSLIKEISVPQVLKEVRISTSTEKIDSGSDLVYTAGTYDQAGEVIPEQDINLVIYGPGDVIYDEKLVKSGEEQTLHLPTDVAPGYWKISARAGGIEQKKLFYVNEVKKIQTSLIEDTLIVTNIGNVPYQGPLQITIGSNTEVRQIDLKVGETQKYKLRAPEGNYQISISDGNAPEVLGNSFLTGNAVQVTDVREGFVETVSNPIIWGLAIVLVIMVAVLVYLKRKGVGSPGSSSYSSQPQSQMMTRPNIMSKPAASNSMPSSTQSSVLMGFKPKPAAPSAVATSAASIQQGAKENASVIVVRAQAPSAPSVNETINKALLAAQSAGAKIYVEGENKIILFSSRLTKQANNEIIAVQTAQKIDEILANHNRMFKDKINYGIGVNDGEIISEIKDGHFKFTTLGSLISGAKRVAFALGSKVLMSDSMHRKVANLVTTQKSPVGETWEIVRIRDRSEYSDFLQRFQKKI